MGENGVTSNAVTVYYSSKGYTVETNYWPSQQEVEDSVINNDATIIYYGNYPDPRRGAHIMFVDYNENTNQFNVYNRRNEDETAAHYEDLSEFFNSHFNRVLVVYSINSEGDQS